MMLVWSYCLVAFHLLRRLKKSVRAARTHHTVVRHNKDIEGKNQRKLQGQIHQLWVMMVTVMLASTGNACGAFFIKNENWAIFPSLPAGTTKLGFKVDVTAIALEVVLYAVWCYAHMSSKQQTLEGMSATSKKPEAHTGSFVPGLQSPLATTAQNLRLTGTPVSVQGALVNSPSPDNQTLLSSCFQNVGLPSAVAEAEAEKAKILELFQQFVQAKLEQQSSALQQVP